MAYDWDMVSGPSQIDEGIWESMDSIPEHKSFGRKMVDSRKHP